MSRIKLLNIEKQKKKSLLHVTSFPTYFLLQVLKHITELLHLCSSPQWFRRLAPSLQKQARGNSECSL